MPKSDTPKRGRDTHARAHTQSKSPARKRAETKSPAPKRAASKSPAAKRGASKSPAPKRNASKTPTVRKRRASASGSGETHTPAHTHTEAPTHASPGKLEAGPVRITPMNPRTTEYEFSGPYLGPLGIIVGLPVLVWASSKYCNGSWACVPTHTPTWEDVRDSFSMQGLILYSAWWAFQALLHLVVPGKLVDGTELRDGSRLKYRINGWNSLLVTVATALLMHFYSPYKLTWICDHIPELATASIVFSFGLSIYLYFSSFHPDALLAVGGNSGNGLYDFFIGRELNPRILGGRLDLKYFCELRPGIFGWWLLNTAMLLKQMESSQGVTPSMWIVYILQAVYIADSVYNEESILTTMDIIQDGFGFMLAFGDLAWVPFMYSLQSRYLAENPITWSNPALVAILAVGVAGFYIFRAANAQKDTFRTKPDDPSVRNLKFIQTSRGSRLLCDGWWGVSRHINYFGDWLLSLGMSLPTGFNSPMTYFYPVYFAVLLIHREIRDEHKCSHKYGKDWEEYKRRVPYRIIPGVY